MQIYLPIAEISVNVLALLGLGGVVGFLSGVFGIGGGFLMTPLLIFAGVPPPVAVATSANQVVASSFSGALAHWRRGNVDLRMGLILLGGGILGSAAGVGVFTLLRGIGQVDLVVSLAYVLFLGTIGILMIAESALAWRRRRNPSAPRRRLHVHLWIHRLPLKMRFRRSKLYISAIAPFLIGLAVSFVSGLMGIGGGFIMIPAMIYLLGMPTSVVVGTSLFQIIFVVANITFLQAVTNQTVDVVLALILLVGSVIGAQVGAVVGGRMRGEQLRALLGVVVLTVGAGVAYNLIVPPADPYSIQTVLQAGP